MFILADTDEQPDGSWLALAHVISGDIFYYWTYHVAIVQSVQYTSNSKNVTPAQIKLIEATWDIDDNNYGSFGCVIKKRTIGGYYSQKNWIIGRLKAE